MFYSSRCYPSLTICECSACLDPPIIVTELLERGVRRALRCYGRIPQLTNFSVSL
jgi:hypothetical protein